MLHVYEKQALLSKFFFFFSSRRRHTRFDCDWSSDVCSSDLSPAAKSSSAFSCNRQKRSSIKATLSLLPGWNAEVAAVKPRSEERRVGKECRSRWSSYHEKKKQYTN